jgi:acetoin utilization deacetylase AcuC-like enzyme
MLKIAFAPLYAHALPEGHRFPMAKYELLPRQLLYEGTLREENFFRPKPLPEAEILHTHQADYWHKLKYLQLSASEIRRTGFPLSAQLVEREITIAQGTIDCAYFALQHGVAMNIAGGTHHAFTNRGEGFCLLNDVAIAANHLLLQGLAKRILVIDLDVHQGNGTAEIFRHQEAVFTFSMHGAKNYPMHKEQSDLDIALEDGTEDKAYLGILEQTLPALIEKHRPDFAFYIAGVDVLATDKLGRLALSLEACRRRDEYVFRTCQAQGIPVVVSMGGGYSPRIYDLVEAHANTFRVAQELYF